jgi:rhamnogalacturonyl hydrolase YesR
MFKFSCLLVALGFVCVSCKSEGPNKNPNQPFELEPKSEDIVSVRYHALLNYNVDSLGFPRSFTKPELKVRKVPSMDWTSGFFPGNLWQIYKLTGDVAFMEKAKQWTAFVEKEKHNNRTHDMGFKVFSSFGEGYKITKDKAYKTVLIESAKTLATRFDANVESIRSWDFNEEVWEFPVIIDNMMNLELLFEATKLSGDSIYHHIAVKHANTTLKNHFRADGSTWHVLDYDKASGKVRARVTHQGVHDNSVWSRGQAWAINGFTMAYRYTKDKTYLDRAMATANYFINHEKMPKDGIPYWDMDHPDIPNISRDVSAAAIIASALVELYGYTNNEAYINYSKKVVDALKTSNYTLEKELNTPFILDHSFGDWSKHLEMDEPIVYGDYYFLKTLLRLRDLKQES